MRILKIKSMVNSGLFAALLFGSLSVNARDVIPLKLKSFILKDKREVMVIAGNTKDYDVFCPQLSVRAVYESAHDYGEVGESYMTINDVYFRAKGPSKVKRFYVGKEEVEEVRAIDARSFIRGVSWDREGTQCFKAELRDYCDFGNLSDSEQKTMEAIIDSSRVSTCEGVQEKGANQLKMRYKALRDLYPLQFLTSLKYLDLSNNQIENIDSLKPLKNLRTVDLSSNPLSSFSALLGHLNLKDLNMSYTQIVNLEGIETLNRLKKLNISNSKVVDLSPILRSKSLRTVYYDKNPLKDKRQLKQMRKRFYPEPDYFWE